MPVALEERPATVETLRFGGGPRAYLIGLPGAGKTSLMRSITASTTCAEMDKPLAHLVYLDGTGAVVGMQLGAKHPTFGGTDRLSMSVQPKAIEFVANFSRWNPGAAIVGEGDRLATRTFLDAFGGQVVWLDTPPALAEHRRRARGSNQSAAWLAGRATKISNLVKHRPHVRLDGSLDPVALRRQAVELVPAFRQLA